MPRTPENLPRHELIGLRVEIEEHPDSNKVGISGEVLDETRDMLRIEDKWVEKEGTTFVFELGEEKIRIKGDIIKKRPEDRVKMSIPDKWEQV
ncbi:ribonuclease P protein component 1 [Candidatus Nanohalobium constans]|uniref:Ribonuclease P protein component 1 n=1 Tax=Candidatus Nanohalobium constans TaxID=2565781 RepID=A0A5Q0UHB7_9ARCH|nr:ribonuclease P protein subunit [Candidatus Nanohalobium constans]QGA80976.1 ribonuclease P protein subunit POP4 (Rpp29) [Candidatus Nanohalobium constans]